MLISFEGIDGSGKTTQAKKLFNYLKGKGKEVSLYREPGGTLLGEKIRELIINMKMDEKCELFLFEASRSQLIHEVVKRDLSIAKIVILDRFIDSTLAYQGYGRGLNIELIKELNALATGGIIPDITFLLDLEPEIALSRVKDRSRFDDLDFLKKVREGFLKIARENAHRIYILSSDNSEEQIFKEILRVLEEKLDLV